MWMRGGGGEWGGGGERGGLNPTEVSGGKPKGTEIDLRITESGVQGRRKENNQGGG